MQNENLSLPMYGVFKITPIRKSQMYLGTSLLLSNPALFTKGPAYNLEALELLTKLIYFQLYQKQLIVGLIGSRASHH